MSISKKTISFQKKGEATPPTLQDAQGVRGFLSRFLEAEKKHSPILFWAGVVGILTGLIGGVFRLVLERTTELRHYVSNLGSVLGDFAWAVPMVYSAVLLAIALFFVRRFAPETGGSGVQEMEGALDNVRPVRWKRVIPVKFFAGLSALGGGLVLGREGPTIQMGGALGKMISDLFKQTGTNAHILIAAGAGAGLAAAFNAPLAGILFVVEEMRPQFKYSFISVQAVMVACAMSDIVVRALTTQAPVIPMNVYQYPALHSLWVFIIFGAIFGVFGFIFNKLIFVMLDFFSNQKGWSYKLIGIYVGAGIGLLAWAYPGTVGGGYQIIPEAVQSKLPVLTLFFLFVVRYGTTVVSYGSGAPGGIFAPMMALGTLFGMWFGTVFDHAIPGMVHAPGVFAIAGMGALFSATVRAPLTGIALAIEMTGNYYQILPLILTCMTATLVAQWLGGKPIYSLLLHRTLELAKRLKSSEPASES